jgi:hypothetical protein
MTKKDWQRHLAYEALVILGVLALLLFVCRLWPILLLAMLGILAATLRLLFLSSTQVRPLEPMPPGAHKPPARTPEEAQASQAFGNLQVQITRQVREQYPNARWVWKTPQAREKLRRGEEAAILLNRAGGYREAAVRPLEGGQVEVRYFLPPEVPAMQEAVSQEEEPAAQTPVPEDHSLSAFEWVEAHMEELGALYNECIAQKQDFLLLTGGDLPEPAAWPALCQELTRNGLESTMAEDGIQIHIKREDRRKE